MLKLLTDVGDLIDGGRSVTFEAGVAAREVARTARTVRNAARINAVVSLAFLAVTAGIVLAYAGRYETKILDPWKDKD
jgi:hypothetical protein